MTTTDSGTGGSVPAPPRELAIDRLVPVHDVRMVQNVVVDAPTDVTFRAIDRLDLGRDRLVAAVSAARLLPDRIRRRRRGEQPTASGDYDRFTAMWTPLAEEQGVEKVLGLVGAFWERDAGLIRVTAEDFASFDRPGFGKVVMSYIVLPYGHGSILALETRVTLTDAAARRRFRRYWTLIGPGAHLITARMLQLIKADAEGR
ncbi:hypothetical protein GCM10010472_22550 [Pseudonocardia halophobica]|uniref:DUF2867 domain-containing protein n=1 Tax=Pseudonocardia halophobica TaxID=29401 RepID=A0A9W6KY98_9PSEU|nr:hypothetical protein [Pseudonocardia halophobica]GLL09487.1 hypothetical protein GCM10017577_06270 [Pseudonocardia halophobica]